MKVLMWGRSKLLETGGGDKIQIENTKLALEKLGVNVTISTSLKEDLSSYDLIHIFQLDWTPECYFYVKKAKEVGKKVILSPIHHNVSEVKKFDDTFVFDFRRLSKLLFNDQYKRDTVKNIYRCAFNQAKIYPTFVSIFMGLKKMHIKSLQMADAILVQTDLEKLDLISEYGVDNGNYYKVENGVSASFLNPRLNDKVAQDLNKLKPFIISVGRIEPRKNQLNIIDAVSLLKQDENYKDLQLLFIGTTSRLNHYEYTKIFEKKACKSGFVHHIDKVAYEAMPSYYMSANLCVSASWFETTGLTLLESLMVGTNAVSSSPRAKEILGDLCEYCEPSDIFSIKMAIEKGLNRQKPTLPDHFRSLFTWENTAQKTLEVYTKIVKSNAN